MALPVIESSDFTGVIKLSQQTYVVQIIEDYIAEYQEQYTRMTIGDNATDTVINLDPLTQKWMDLFDGVTYKNINSDKNCIVKGLTYSLKRFIYFEYLRDNWINTNTGNVRNKNENADTLDPKETNGIATSRYNNGVRPYNNEILSFLENYKDFEGTIDSFVDNGGGNYTINSSNTIYLENTDTVTIDNVDYVVSNVIDNTSFDISGDTGLTFSGVYIYNPYEAVIALPFEYLVL